MQPAYFERKLECAARREIRSLQLERLKSVIAKVYDRVPRYREKCEALGVRPGHIRSLYDVTKLPFTTKDDLRQTFPCGLFSEPLKKVVRLHSSSGTTGLPTVVGYTRKDIATWSQLTARVLVAGGLTSSDIVQISFGYGLFTGAFGMHYGAERVGATVIPISTGNSPRQIMTMRNFGTTALICTPSYALQVFDTAREMGVEFGGDWPLRLGFFGAEPWTESMRSEIESKMQILATDNYGLSEIIGPGFSGECVHKCGLHIAEDHFLSEILDPRTEKPVAPGEQGELVITTLTKEALPLLRYRTRDLTSIDYERCACGRTMARMKRVQGRSDDMLIIKGVNVFPSQVEEVLLSISGVAPVYRIIVDRAGRLDTMTVEVELLPDAFGSSPRKKEILGRIKGSLLAVLGIQPQIHLAPPHSIPRSEGKAQRVIDKRPKA